MKEFFDRCYYGALDRIQGLPYACAISAGSDAARRGRPNASAQAGACARRRRP